MEAVSMDDFTLLKVLGKGSYAKVVLVRKKTSDRLYAMKILKKKHIEKKKQEFHIQTERNVLVEVDHPFVIKLYFSFQTPEKLFFVLDYCPGGELFGLLSKKSRFSEEQAKFFAAQMVLALEYLHEKNIIYRDLKPENVLIDAQGFIRLTDFGLSKMFMTQSDAFSICGTPEYLAPEILFKEGHGKPVDWWCLGSIIFEMVTGLPPFNCSRNELFDKIKFQNPNIPPFISQKLKSLLNGLFQKKPELRLGTKSPNEIKSHPWFQNIDWKKLYNKQVKPQFVPTIKSETDVSNFDAEFTELLPESHNAEGLQPGGQFAGKLLRDLGFSYDDTKKSGMEVEEQNTGEICMNIEGET